MGYLSTGIRYVIDEVTSRFFFLCITYVLPVRLCSTVAYLLCNFMAIEISHLLFLSIESLPSISRCPHLSTEWYSYVVLNCQSL